MEVDEKPTEKYNDVGGLDKQIEELVEAIVLADEGGRSVQEDWHQGTEGCVAPSSWHSSSEFTNPAVGALMYGPPGTGKTLLARACAAQTDATFLKLAGPQLVQMFIGDGAKLVRDCFALAKEKAPRDYLHRRARRRRHPSVSTARSGDREVQRTMLELLNQLDGFASDDRIKVLAATGRCGRRWIPLCCVPAVSTARSSSPCPTRKRVPRFSRFILGR